MQCFHMGKYSIRFKVVIIICFCTLMMLCYKKIGGNRATKEKEMDKGERQIIEITDISRYTTKQHSNVFTDSASTIPQTMTTGKSEDERPGWLGNVERMDHVYNSLLRCGGESMGCFTLKSVVPPVKNVGTLDKHQCLYECFKSSHSYAGVAKNGKCYCSLSLKTFVTTVSCGAACSRDLASNCQASNSVMIFRKTINCQRGVTDEWLDQARIACVELPHEKNDAMLWLNMSNSTIQQCILNCEKRLFTLAIPSQQHSMCLCSNSFSLFESADNMYGAMQSCPEGNQPSSNQRLLPVYRTLAHDNHCEPKRFLKPKQGPLTIVTSFPGSGNTWLRHLIESATGIYTGSFYNDIKLFDGGLIGEREYFLSGRTIAIKDHLFKFKISEKYTSAILLVRNLYDATLADFARQRTRKHAASVDPGIYKIEAFKKFATSRPRFWTGAPKKLFEIISSVLVVYFEDLKLDPVTQLRRIVEFLPESVLEMDGEELERKLMCMNMDLSGNFKRAPRKLDFDPFDEELRTLYTAAMQELDSIMKENNQPPLPTSYFNP